MKYTSTRNKLNIYTSEQVLNYGLAPDGGLFIPDHLPRFSQDSINSLKGSNYQDIAFFILKPFLSDLFSDIEIKKIIDESKISYAEVKNLYFFPSKRWDLELVDNTIIKLPNDNVYLALNLAIEFLSDHKFIDARIKNQIILND